MIDCEVPSLVRTTALAQGEVGRRWLDALPGTVAALAAQWRISVGTAMAGGTAGFVAEATGADGAVWILKVAAPSADDPDGGFEQALEALRLAGGRGCVRLIAHDAGHHALLMERLGRNLDALQLPVERQLDIIAATVRQMWVPVPERATLPTGAKKARWLSDFIAHAWEALERPCSRRTVEIARDYAAQRAAAFDRATAVLVHGDAHSGNTLEAGEGTFKLVDPEGLVSEPAHDLGIAMREFNRELLAGDTTALARAWARRLGEATGVDSGVIWQWGFIERVSSGLYTLQVGHSGARDFLTIADRLAERI